MGTSQSSDGSPSGVPMVPPWVPPPPGDKEGTPPDASPDGAPDPGDTDMPHDAEPDQDGQAAPSDAAAPSKTAPVAPAGRFGPARRSLGGFASSGDSRAMRRGIGHYVRKGYGGAGNTVRRFGGTVSAAGALYSALSPGVPGSGTTADAEPLRGKSASDVMDAMVEAVRPVDGSLDAESGRPAIRNALSDLLERYPEADLGNLTEEQRLFSIERYVALDVYRRLVLDVGKHIQKKAPSAAAELSRLKQIKDYMQETVGAAFRKIKSMGRTITNGTIGSVVRDALRETFNVFEDYVE